MSLSRTLKRFGGDGGRGVAAFFDADLLDFEGVAPLSMGVEDI